jgi:O-methyltransferase
VRGVYRAKRNIETASTWVEHLAMIEQVLAVPSDVPGVVVEAGTFKGGSAASMSLACRRAGRRLVIFDSFEGLPEPSAADDGYAAGDFRGTLDEVRANIERYGAIEVCEFVRGYFDDTMPGFSEPVVQAFVDVDLIESLRTCLRNLWPNLQPGCRLYSHEAAGALIARAFFDDEWWQRELGTPSPGLVGAGCGIPVSAVRDTPLGYAVKAAVPAAPALAAAS